MKWIKTHLITGSGILFSVFFLALLSSCLFGINNTYATSVSCRIDGPLTRWDNQLSSFCDLSSLDSSKVWYFLYHFQLIDSFDPGNSGSEYSVYFNTSPDPYSSYRFYIYFSRFTSSYLAPDPYPLFYSGILSDDYSSTGKRFVSLNFNGSLFYQKFDYLDLIVYDIEPSFDSSAPSGSLSITENGTYDVTNYAEAVVDVSAEVIQGDYHDDLVSINNSILICAAVCLVIYFFYCIYRMIIKPLRS